MDLFPDYADRGRAFAAAVAGLGAAAGVPGEPSRRERGRARAAVGRRARRTGRRGCPGRPAARRAARRRPRACRQPGRRGGAPRRGRARPVAAPPADLAAPRARRLRPADAVRAGDGALGVVGGGYAAGGSSYSVFTKQLMFCALGLVLFCVGLRIPPRQLRAAGRAAAADRRRAAGRGARPRSASLRNGSRAWFAFGPFTLQPSEAARWRSRCGGRTCWRLRRAVMHRWKYALSPVVPVTVC